MKNFIYILSLMMLSSALAACSNEKTTDKLENTQLKSVAVQLQEKETKDVVWLKSQALYKFDAVEGSKEYIVFIHADDEQSMIQESKEGGKNQVFTGTYSIYLAEKDSSVAYKQADLSGEDVSTFTFNSSINGAYSIQIGNNTIIVVPQPSEKGKSKLYLYSIKDGELRKIITEEKMADIFGTEIKLINQKCMQTVHLQKNNVWKFITWEFEEHEFTIAKVDESQFDETTKALGEVWYKRWSEQREFFYPFHNIELTSDIVEKAKHGIPLGSPYPIGTNIANIKKSELNFMEEGTINKNTSYLMYPEITYYYEQSTGTVTAVSIPGERVKTTINHVNKLLGKPERVEQTSKGETRSIYNADKYIVEFLSEESGKVKKIYLARK